MKNCFINICQCFADEFAVPDYPSGATEHWGLITYRESRLLYDPNQVGSYDNQKIASIISHELAHSVSLFFATMCFKHCS